MGDERAEGEPLQSDAVPAVPRCGRLRVALIAAVVLAVIAAGAFLSGGAPEAPSSAGDAAATLDTALAAGTPAYVLIHSLT